MPPLSGKALPQSGLRTFGWPMFFVVLVAIFEAANGQGCESTCPPLNGGQPVDSLCVGDDASNSLSGVSLPVCHPTGEPSIQISNYVNTDPPRLLVISNYYVGCNAGRREANVYAAASKYIHSRHPNVIFLSSLKGGSSSQCTQWANSYSNAGAAHISAEEQQIRQPLIVNDQSYQLRDEYFTSPYPHPSYIIIDSTGQVREKFVGPCCGRAGYYDCSTNEAMALNDTLHEKLLPLLQELETGDANCSITNWTDWSECECASGNFSGNQQRTREVLQNEVGSGTCPALEESQECSCTSPVNCEVSAWSEWSECSVMCGSGVRYHTRTVTTQPAFNGTECPALAEQENCTQAACQEQCVPLLGEALDIQVIASAAQGLDSPRDVVFHPEPGMHLGNFSSGQNFSTTGEEAWIANGHGHAVTIVTGIGEAAQQFLTRYDRGYYHYMVNITGISFNMVKNSGRDPGRDTYASFATCQLNNNTYTGLKDPNFFQGPTLYSSSPEYRNLVRHDGGPCTPADECFFLHTDMLHESPSCRGIVHDPETDTAYGTVYWTIDGVHGHLVRFDFQQPHGAGFMDHSIAAVRRYPEVSIAPGPHGVHQGMVIDPDERALYVASAGSGSIVKLMIDSGVYARTARGEYYSMFSSQLPSFEYSIYSCAEYSTFATGLDTPSGLALSAASTSALGADEPLLLYVAEYATGNVVVFDVSTGFRVRSYATVGAGLMGLSFAPRSHRLYGVNALTNQLLEIKPQANCSGAFSNYVNTNFTLPSALSDVAAEQCDPNTTIPNASLFVQVHVTTGYADDNEAVQNDDMRDESAALLANRTDCEPESVLNFDALLLGGYFCHNCLPDNCATRDGGVCSNIWFTGYSCDNEFRVTHTLNLSGSFWNVDQSEIVLDENRTYRFIVNARGAPVEAKSNGSSVSGPMEVGILKVTTTDTFPDSLVGPDGYVIATIARRAPTSAPTDAPTPAPPTAAPTTAAPTTAAPTDASTAAPTNASTAAPTNASTAVPTEAPTIVLTTAPTEAPTAAITSAPTTTAPTDASTAAPTEPPTAAVTTAPTEALTVAPSVAPSPRPPGSTPAPSAPTASQTLAPSAPPTAGVPTVAPTDIPTEAPTKTPTSVPTPPMVLTWTLLKRGRGCSRVNGEVYTMYALADGRQGWSSTSLSECKDKCVANDIENYTCRFVVWADNQDWPPGWCHLASACSLDEKYHLLQTWQMEWKAVTPPPTAPSPTGVTSTPTAPASTTLKTKIALGNATDFDTTAYIVSMASTTGVSEDAVQVVDVAFTVAASYQFPSGTNVTEAQAITAIAASNNVNESAVSVTMTGARRLASTGRRLAVQVDAEITTSDASVAQAAMQTSSNASALASQLSAVVGAAVEAPTVVAAPTVAVEVSTMVTSTGGTTIAPPEEDAFRSAFSGAIGKAVTVSIEVQTPVPAVSPTSQPTAAPTAAPTQEQPTAPPTASQSQSCPAADVRVEGALLMTLVATNGSAGGSMQTFKSAMGHALTTQGVVGSSAKAISIHSWQLFQNQSAVADYRSACGSAQEAANIADRLTSVSSADLATIIEDVLADRGLYYTVTVDSLTAEVEPQDSGRQPAEPPTVSVETSVAAASLTFHAQFGVPAALVLLAAFTTCKSP